MAAFSFSMHAAWVFFVAQAFDEGCGVAHGTDEAVALQNSPILGLDALDASQSDGGGVPGERFQRHRLIAPADHGLLMRPLVITRSATAPLAGNRRPQERNSARGRGRHGRGRR